MKAPHLCLPFILLLFGLPTSHAEERPNVILIMADDMGYEALSSNGSESRKSPNLDKLAEQGVRFTNCFSNPICTPSRAKIMTGQYNVRNYVKFGMLDRGQTTFAHQLKAAGYATCIAGKWQLGNQPDSPQHLDSKNPVFGNTRARVAPMKTGNESIAASSIQCLSSTANKRTTRTVNTVPRYAQTLSVTLSRRTRRTPSLSISQ